MVGVGFQKALLLFLLFGGFLKGSLRPLSGKRLVKLRRCCLGIEGNIQKGFEKAAPFNNINLGQIPKVLLQDFPPFLNNRVLQAHIKQHPNIVILRL